MKREDDLIGHEDGVQLSEAETDKYFPEKWNISPRDPRVREAVYRAYNGRCFYSGRPVPEVGFVVEHLVPPECGGRDNLANYVLTIPSLNSEKGRKFITDAVEGPLYRIRCTFLVRMLKLLADQPRKKKRNLWFDTTDPIPPEKRRVPKLVTSGRIIGVIQHLKGYRRLNYTMRPEKEKQCKAAVNCVLDWLVNECPQACEKDWRSTTGISMFAVFHVSGVCPQDLRRHKAGLRQVKFLYDFPYNAVEGSFLEMEYFPLDDGSFLVRVEYWVSWLKETGIRLRPVHLTVHKRDLARCFPKNMLRNAVDSLPDQAL